MVEEDKILNCDYCGSSVGVEKRYRTAGGRDGGHIIIRVCQVHQESLLATDRLIAHYNADKAIRR